MKFVFIRAEKGRHSVKTLCRVLGVSPAGFYAWQARPPSKRAQEDERLKHKVREAHARAKGVYGSPRVHQALKEEEPGLGRRRTARLMREEGLWGKPLKPYVVTTESTHHHTIPENILDRCFDVDEPNRVWAGDITYIATMEGWLYLAVVLDLFSRRVVGWAISNNLRAGLALDALEMAVDRRQPGPGLVFHSDRGVQYACHAFRAQLAQHGMHASMSRKGDCWDNAPVESFFRTLKVEGLPDTPSASRQAAELKIFEFIEGFYNHHRLHSYLGYVSPAEHEERYAI